ncbi:adenosine deaminase [Myceligenerans salitolerans]|uniref:adenosine deaminase n=1 Tax=Myceligenerans salitolerans TaxID=1230528 RepID=A0ABS3I5N7_9MICO|nr:adenosine deaminase [Myceligenerans salitolerans]MBO0607936.1 adenosine deaminase [Myceligenerans salitolerans]
MTHLGVDTIQALPKVLLHDHLDGGLRPGTVSELADAVGHELPAAPAGLADWFARAADSHSLVRYLETFAHTVAVMQTAEALERVAREAVLDLAADGVVHAELRWAPEQHLERGLTMTQAVEAVQTGIDDGVARAAADGRTIRAGQILTAMRQADRWTEVADLAIALAGDGVLGFDLAGPEDGFPPGRHDGVWRHLAAHQVPVTIHAGEAAGVDSVAEALHTGQALRLGHGVRIADDITFGPGDAPAELGPVAHWVRDQQIPLEVCPVSNTQTGAAESVAAHPITRLKELDFAVTLNTDNRLMSRTSMTREMMLLNTEAGWTLEDLLDVTVAAAWSAFVHHDERRTLVEQVIVPGFQKIERAQL